MSKKRFVYNLCHGDEWFEDTVMKKEYDLCMPIGETIVELLNELEDEKQYWKDKALPHSSISPSNQFLINSRFSLKLGRFYRDNTILQHEEVLDLLNKYSDKNEQLNKTVETLDLDDMTIAYVLKLIDKKIWKAKMHRTRIDSLDYGDDLGYWNGAYQQLKKLKKELLE